jgi:fluoride exporter
MGVTMTWIAVAIGGALGSMARHWVNLEMAFRLGRVSNHATFVVNVAGCFVVGTLAGLIASGRLHMSQELRTFVFVGVLGGFTTFSTFGLDTFTLAQGGLHAKALWNVAGQIVLGLGSVWIGFTLAHL